MDYLEGELGMSRVSVIITAYNEEDHIYKCLTSLQLQTYKKMEIIVVDNGSTDSTYTIAESVFADRTKPIRVYKLKDNRGPGGGRNYGASKAKGDILCFLDADMMFRKDYIEKLVEPIIKGKEIGTFHGREKVANIENKWARAWSIERVVDPPEYSGVFRAILASEFKGFDNSKGYFDDDIGLSKSRCVPEAVCYHNNPSSLKEAYEQCKWIGKSLSVGVIYSYIKELSIVGFMIGIIYLMFSLFLIKMGTPIKIIVLVNILGIIGGFIGLIGYYTLIRYIRERYLSHIFCVPILKIVQYYGYLIGMITKNK